MKSVSPRVTLLFACTEERNSERGQPWDETAEKRVLVRKNSALFSIDAYRRLDLLAILFRKQSGYRPPSIVIFYSYE